MTHGSWRVGTPALVAPAPPPAGTIGQESARLWRYVWMDGLLERQTMSPNFNRESQFNQSVEGNCPCLSVCLLSCNAVSAAGVAVACGLWLVGVYCTVLYCTVGMPTAAALRWQVAELDRLQLYLRLIGMYSLEMHEVSIRQQCEN
jgi:hypothetical protein